ncbi:MAG: prenyltransferase, partial [Planctomycetes bacterium]|nr:prenyltransferase [Planctomycetota bacterium]
GSWRYVPFAQDSDMSITVCQVQALRAARNVGLRVPRTTIDRAIAYIKDSAITHGPERGSFKYQPQFHTRSSYALTAAAIAALHGAGVYEDADIERGLDYLQTRHRAFWRGYRNSYFYYYGHYYAVQAMFIAGGRHWQEYFPRVSSELLAAQQPDGSWPNDIGPGPVFGTAAACIILQIPLHYLPIFQR